MYSKHQRFLGIKRNYSPEDVERLRGSLKIEYTLAKRGSKKLWDYLTRGGASYINALGALTGKKSVALAAFRSTLASYFSIHVKHTHFPNMVKAPSTRAICLCLGLHSLRLEIDRIDITNLNGFQRFLMFSLKLDLKFNRKFS